MTEREREMARLWKAFHNSYDLLHICGQRANGYWRELTAIMEPMCKEAEARAKAEKASE